MPSIRRRNRSLPSALRAVRRSGMPSVLAFRYFTRAARADFAASARSDAKVSGLSAIACQASKPSNSRAMEGLPHLFDEICEHYVGSVAPLLGKGRMRIDLAERFGDGGALENLGREHGEFRA